MKSLRTSTRLRLLVVALMSLSWLVITNHCALARMQTQPSAEKESPCCHEKSAAPVKEAPCQELAECCRSVKASLSSNAEAKYDASKFQLELCALLPVLSIEVATPAPAVAFDHGPPRAISFAESVLQRSLLSHAPPFSA